MLGGARWKRAEQRAGGRDRARASRAAAPVADPPKLVMMATRQLRLPSDLLDIPSPSHRPHSRSLTHASYHHRRFRCDSSQIHTRRLRTLARDRRSADNDLTSGRPTGIRTNTKSSDFDITENGSVIANAGCRSGHGWRQQCACTGKIWDNRYFQVMSGRCLRK